MSDELDVRKLDPALPAPNVVLSRPAGGWGEYGHSRIAPMVGGQRPHTYDVEYASGSMRVYADTPGLVLAAVIADGYETLTRELLAAAQEPYDRDRMEAAMVAAFFARDAHAHATRIDLQKRVNAQAKANGWWDRLDDEERFQLEAAAAGQVPMGLIMERALPGTDEVVEQTYWINVNVPLVINRGDYGLFSPSDVPEPVALSTDPDREGSFTVEHTRWPSTMVLLDPTDEIAYLQSLARSGLLDVTTHPVDLPDAMWNLPTPRSAAD